MLHAIMKGQLVSWGIYSFSREKCLIFKLKKKPHAVPAHILEPERDVEGRMQWTGVLLEVRGPRVIHPGPK